jgi:EmrB/QacA subfamily drug resistance transporter
MDTLLSSTQNRVSKKIVLFIIMITSFLTPFMASSTNIALPQIGREFETDAVLLAWISTSYLVSTTVFLLPFGRIADIYGRKRIFTYGIIIYTISSLLAVTSNSAIMLILVRIPQGIGGAMIFGTGIAILTSVYPLEERGKVIGINVATVYLGLSLGPFLGGLLTQYFSWRSIFLVNLPLGLVIIILILWKLKGDWADAKGEKFDLSGSMIYGFAVVALMYGISLLPEISGLVVILIGVLGFMAFVWWEIRIASPILNITLFRNNRVFVFSNLAALINYSATYAVTFLLSLYLQYTKGFSPQNAGLVLASMPAVQAIFSPLAGRLSDKIAPRILASGGMLLTTTGLILLSFIGQNTAIWYLLVSLMVLGFGFAFFSSPNTNAIMSSIEAKTYGVGSATLATMRQIGNMFSMGITMLIFVIYIGRVEITPEYYSVFVTSIKITFVIFAVLCFGGIFASLAREKATIV